MPSRQVQPATQGAWQETLTCTLMGALVLSIQHHAMCLANRLLQLGGQVAAMQAHLCHARSATCRTSMLGGLQPRPYLHIAFLLVEHCFGAANNSKHPAKSLPMQGGAQGVLICNRGPQPRAMPTHY